MYGQPYWYGKEVEGRLSNIETVFIRHEIPSNYTQYPHVYFTIEFIKTIVKTNNWDIIRPLFKTMQMITIEATADVFDQIPPDVFNAVHIIYRIQDKHLQRLKKTDTLSIDSDWYRVHQITKCNMMEITPDDYLFDRLNQ